MFHQELRDTLPKVLIKVLLRTTFQYTKKRKVQGDEISGQQQLVDRKG